MHRSSRPYSPPLSFTLCCLAACLTVAACADASSGSGTGGQGATDTGPGQGSDGDGQDASGGDQPCPAGTADCPCATGGVCFVGACIDEVCSADGPDAGSGLDGGATDTGSGLDAGVTDTGSGQDSGTADTGSEMDSGATDTGPGQDSGATDTGSGLTCGESPTCECLVDECIGELGIPAASACDLLGQATEACMAKLFANYEAGGCGVCGGSGQSTWGLICTDAECAPVKDLLNQAAVLTTQCDECVCMPDCTGKPCGDDGCGGSCGTCGGDAPETCNDMYTCLIEAGCGCTLGVDCPEGDGTGPCLQTCFGDQDCYNGCLGTLSPDTQSAWGDWQQCLGGACADAPDFEGCYVGQCLNAYAGCFLGCGDTTPPSKDVKANKAALVECTTAECSGLDKEADLSGCYFDKCIAEATQCLYNGDATCEEGFFGCFTQCAENDDQCTSGCIQTLSSQGAYDLFTWDGCRFDLCDADGDGQPESNECLVASFLACSDKMASCGPDWPGADGCNTTTGCIIGCGGLGPDTTCVDGCLSTMSGDALSEVSAVFSCAIGACGTTADAITSACIEAALANECAAEAATCGFAP